MDFQPFKQAVAKQFEKLMATGQMFRTNTDKDELWDMYLNSFPEGTNPIYRERTEHDCSCCRQFIKSVGNAVAFVDGKLETVWDIDVGVGLNSAYQVVAACMAEYVRGHSVCDVFLHDSKTAGTDRNFEELTTGVKTWDHFFVNLKPQYVAKGADIPTKLGELRSTVQVFQRGLDTISLDAIDTTLELMAQGTLYRGAEFKRLVEQFNNELLAYHEHLAKGTHLAYVWNQGVRISPALARIRNSAIGTLLQNLSEGMELEQAVRAWETVMAPTNYKRPTALVTPKMIEQAKATIGELGLTSALERRYANLTDITVNNILFADRNAKKAMGGDVFDDLMDRTKASAKSLEKVETIYIDDFISSVLPRISSMEVLLENKHTPNLVSLVAPADPTAGQLFKWDNNFSWSYNGEVTDSIKERVKAAGGNVTGDLCCRLAWDYTDDLDLHLEGPMGHIYFGDRRKGGGMLDVDANGGDGMKAEPCENIFFGSHRTLMEGAYTLKVHQYNARQTAKAGFQAEIDFMGNVTQFSYDKPLRRGEYVTVATFKYSVADGFQIVKSLPSSQSSKIVYGLPTQTFHKVSTLLLSPNHWDDKVVGNKHFFFILDGAKADAPARGFYNEFLKGELTPHRKVFEIVGSKMKVADSPDQLSGLGFSSTQQASLTVRVSGSFTRVLNIIF